MSERSRVPSATYRLQLVPGELDFDGASRLVAYLARLGITHVYCSPVLAARPGSTHGYDVADPRQVSTDLGGEQGLRALADAAADHGLGLVVDIVPNHLGVGPSNPLWESLLAEGRHGDGAEVFDVDWAYPMPGAEGKVILPILGEPYGSVLHSGQLQLSEEPAGLRVRYHEHSFPLSADSASKVAELGGPSALHGTPGDPGSWDELHAMLEAQHYRPVHWRAGGALVNYRRFFTVDDLAAVRVERPEVFERTHRTILRLVGEGVVDGLRVDHPDGLRDPGRYLTRLAEETGGAWIVVEKILEPGEELPDWPVAGTTGYEFGTASLGLFVDADARPVLDEVDRFFGGSEERYAAAASRAKGEVVRDELSADADRLAHRLWRLAQDHREVRDVGERDCRDVVRRTLQALDVYRTYVDPVTGAARDLDVARIDAAVERAAGELPDGSVAYAPGFLYEFFADVLSGRAGSDPDHLELVARFQQLSGAVMAKGIEDTVLYRNRRLLAVNEVGGDPERLGTTVDGFHRANLDRAARHPAGMLTTTTHDTKRGEDVRLRIAALTERAERWAATARLWRELNATHIGGTRTGPAPDPQTELLLYQTLVAVWPVDGTEPDDELRQRVIDYAVKASREAGERTDWRDPDPEFEAGLEAFITAVLDQGRSGEFVESLNRVAREVAEIAMISGLSQTLLRATSPGVPDTYQGMELWGDNLVDPDNRRPVDFNLRERLLADVASRSPEELFAARSDGRIKLWLLARALDTRRTHVGAYGPAAGYVPLAVEGRWGAHLVAFARTAPDGLGPITLAVRLPGALMGEDLAPPLGAVWEDTAVVLPEQFHVPLQDALSGRSYAPDARLHAADALARLPVGLLVPA